jgi:hypothetical protein
MRWIIGLSNFSDSPSPNLWRNETSEYARKKTNESEIAMAMKAGAVDGGADKISLDVAPGITDVSIITDQSRKMSEKVTPTYHTEAKWK